MAVILQLLMSKIQSTDGEEAAMTARAKEALLNSLATKLKNGSMKSKEFII